MGRNKKLPEPDDDDDDDESTTEKVSVVRKKKKTDRSVNNVQDQDKVGLERLQRLVTATCDKCNIDNLSWTVGDTKYFVGSEIISDEE